MVFKSQSRIVDPHEVIVSIELQASLSDWKCIKEQLREYDFTTLSLKNILNRAITKIELNVFEDEKQKE